MKTKKQQFSSSESEAPDQANNEVIAAVAGRRLLLKKEWNKTHVNGQLKCSTILDGYAND